MEKKTEAFYTVRGYERLSGSKTLTSSMEDYLEMAYRLSRDKGYTRISELAAALNVQPPSATSMVQKLSDYQYMNYQKYGVVELTSQGKELGAYLLERHKTIEEFLLMLGVEAGVLEETEKIEHNVSSSTMECIMILVNFFKEDQEVLERFAAYRSKWKHAYD